MVSAIYNLQAFLDLDPNNEYEIIYKAQYTNVNYLEVLNELANMI